MMSLSNHSQSLTALVWAGTIAAYDKARYRQLV
jgi:hypothetical protein